MPKGPIVTSNTILSTLPASELERLGPYLKHVTLEAGKQLFSPGERADAIYFMESGAVTRYTFVASGESVETGVFGAGSVVGFPRIFGDRPVQGAVVVTVPGSALVMSVADFFDHAPPGSALYEIILNFALDYMSAIAQIAACHALHRLEARLARLLLTFADYSGDAPVPVTHDALSEMLGVHRPSVTYALQALAQAGAVATERRSLRVRDRDALAQRTCECYAAVRRLLGHHGGGRSAAAS